MQFLNITNRQYKQNVGTDIKNRIDHRTKVLQTFRLKLEIVLLNFNLDIRFRKFPDKNPRWGFFPAISAMELI
jgi:hypothetical protein